MTGLLTRCLLVALSVYVVLFGALYVFQRRLMYFPSGPVGPPSAFGLPATEAMKVQTEDGERIVAWYQSPRPGRPLYLYFHGNGGTLPVRADFLRRLTMDGAGFFAIDYRGYGGSTGTPNEKGLLADGRAAYAKVRALGIAPEHIVVIGESLGTGVAIPLAAHQSVAALVVAGSFSATVDVAAARYWMFPVRLAMEDTFRSIALIAKVKAPKLFLHGSDDDVIPIAFARRLYNAASPPKAFVSVPDGGHMVMWAPEVVDRVRTWVAENVPMQASHALGRAP